MTAAELPVTRRDLELAWIALNVAAQSCQTGATLHGRDKIEPLAREYLTAAWNVKRLADRLGFGEL